MNKPVHKTFTREDYPNTFHTTKTAGMRQVLDSATKDLLQPRPEVIASILRLSRLSKNTHQ